MRDRPAWIRGCAAVTAWATVTAVAAAGSWLGLSSVFASDTVNPTDTVLATILPSASSSSSHSPSPSESSESDYDGGGSFPSLPPQQKTMQPPTQEPVPEVEPLNGWTPVGEGRYERTFDTAGGTAVVQLSAEAAVFISASPAEGYTASRSQPSPTHLIVTFKGSDRTVEINSVWKNDQPHGKISSVN